MCSSPSTGASLGVVKIQASELVVSIVSRCGSKHHSVSVCNRQFTELHYMTACAIQDSCHPGTRLGVTHLESSTRSTQLTPWVNSIAASSVRFAAVSPRLLAVSIPVELSSSCELMPGVRYLQRSTVGESVRPEILRLCRCLLAGLEVRCDAPAATMYGAQGLLLGDCTEMSKSTPNGFELSSSIPGGIRCSHDAGSGRC